MRTAKTNAAFEMGFSADVFGFDAPRLAAASGLRILRNGNACLLTF
jgi:hypothetical protein